MSREEVFDSFYRATRNDVLLQAFLLTGDLTAATSAVRDAYAITWQHWKKVQARAAAGAPPISYVRPLAWRLAQRRHTGRIWHRNKGLSDEHNQVLEAMHRLPGGARRAVLLVDVAGVDVTSAARELATTSDRAKDRLARARDELTAALGASYADRLRELAGPASSAALPRPSIVLRAGQERGRYRTVGAVLAAVALTVGVGAAAREPGTSPDAAGGRLLPAPTPRDDSDGQTPADDVEPLNHAQLLSAARLIGVSPGQSWREVSTDDNTGGDGINTICQRSRFADPAGVAALRRTYDARGKPPRTALQTVEVSHDEASASRAYATTVRWFAGCDLARLQMLSAHRVTGVGDQAQLLRMRLARTPTETYDVAVARERAVTTTLVVRSTGTALPQAGALAGALADAVRLLCPDDAGACVTRPRAVATPPPPSGEEPGFVATVDLPPAGRIRRPWVGVPAVGGLGVVDEATRCDRPDFRRAGVTRARSRTFLIPHADLPRTFGFTQTVGRFRSDKAAAAFMAAVRRNVASCEDVDMTTDVTNGHTQRRPDMSVWRFESNVSDDVTVTFRVGFVRRGNMVTKLSFVPDTRHDMDPQAFTALVRRAGERLKEMPR